MAICYRCVDVPRSVIMCRGDIPTFTQAKLVLDLATPERCKCSTSGAYQKYFSYSLEYHKGLF